MTTRKDNIKKICSHVDKSKDSVKYRKYLITNLLKNTKLKPLINLENDTITTESFTGPANSRHIVDGYKSTDETSYHTRDILGKKFHVFSDIITQIGGKLKYIKSGTTGHTFKGIIDDDGKVLNYGVKVSAFPRKRSKDDINNSKDDPYDVRRPENTEIKMIRVLSYFVLKRETPHISLPIGTFDTNIAPFTKLMDDDVVPKDCNKYKEFLERYQNNYYHNKVSILLSEWANKGDLLSFIKNYYKEFKTMDWKIIFFQVLSVLAVIQHKYPMFRHNDLKANNILVNSVKGRGNKYSYMICKTKFIVPNSGFCLKLWDFDFACIPGVVDNFKVNEEWTNRINVKPVQNRYYDMHFFFNTLTNINGFLKKEFHSKYVSKDVKDFANRMVPDKYRKTNTKFVSKRGRILVDVEYLTPEQVLKNDPFFKEFRDEAIKRDKLKKLK